ncbi:hypothetical protein ABIA43_001988 [Bradyrhizobium sp. USDA 328]
MPSGPMAPNSRQRCAPHEQVLNQPRSASGGTSVPAGTKVWAISKSSLRASMHRALHIEMPHLLNAIMRRSCIETTAERTMNPAVDHFCLSGLTLCPRLKNERRINGEVDERGHEMLRNLQVSNTIPDLLVHIPGDGTAISAGLARAPRRARFSDGVAINRRRGRHRDRGTQRRRVDPLEGMSGCNGPIQQLTVSMASSRRITAQTIAE